MLLSCCGIGRFQSLQRIKNNLRDDQAGVVLIVCGDNIPGSVMRTGCAEALFISLHVVLPKLSFVNIREAQLPVLLWIVDARQETLALLILREVQKDFHDARTVSVEML